ncbi:glycosyltransferase family 4 protein [Robertmurraya andreesenii]|uniref:Glycosyltransferase involved in cell wall biosynthesis n=1 Tax=Anoxybacillus andreesenii TaxID=1325932 RepID=A0ABT9V355_9BACL|nr:glycosyltransferase family 4 protein [Robertmurraya andreesenii]MDQ0155369.1 glycosyltransferase involved in cell wall biosynthesis [Robertmurraya andreesenii]
MNLMWIVNIPLPEASELMNEKALPFAGWLENSSSILSNMEKINLNIAFPKKGLNKIKTLKGKKITYFAFPAVNTSSRSIERNNYLKEMINQVTPDYVHIFGTEYSHTLAVVNLCKEKNIKVIISIQGLVSVIAKHYLASLPSKVQKSYTFRALVTMNNIRQQQRKFFKRGKYEIEALRKVDYVIGRTTWDKACCTQINPNLQYFHCNETLRNEFYENQWDINTCERFSIFLSQGSYPVKGLHFMIEAMPQILRRFPECKLYVGGPNITNTSTLIEKLKLTPYGKYIQTLIKKYNLHSKIIFTGILNEKEMCNRYLGSHVFVCPSSIENSPNSLGEAMLLGVPSVSADVGGISDLLIHKEEGYVYQGDAPYMLAHFICEIFGDDEIALKFSKNARNKAKKTHDRELNNERLIEIYHTLTK